MIAEPGEYFVAVGLLLKVGVMSIREFPSISR
jgi:hypothetical protein